MTYEMYKAVCKVLATGRSLLSALRDRSSSPPTLSNNDGAAVEDIVEAKVLFDKLWARMRQLMIDCGGKGCRREWRAARGRAPGGLACWPEA